MYKVHKAIYINNNNIKTIVNISMNICNTLKKYKLIRIIYSLIDNNLVYGFLNEWLNKITIFKWLWQCNDSLYKGCYGEEFNQIYLPDDVN